MIYKTKNNPRALLKLIAEQQDKIYNLEAIIKEAREYCNTHYLWYYSNDCYTTGGNELLYILNRMDSNNE